MEININDVLNDSVDVDSFDVKLQSMRRSLQRAKETRDSASPRFWGARERSEETEARAKGRRRRERGGSEEETTTSFFSLRLLFFSLSSSSLFFSSLRFSSLPIFPS